MAQHNTSNVRMVLGERPDTVPPTFLIYNAPRPIYGDSQWQGEFLAGCFYAAVDPTGERAAWMVRENVKLDASLLMYISEEEAFQNALKLIRQEEPNLGADGEATLLEPHNRSWVINYYLNNWREHTPEMAEQQANLTREEELSR